MEANLNASMASLGDSVTKEYNYFYDQEYAEILNLTGEYPTSHNDSIFHASIGYDAGQYVLPHYVKERWDAVLFHLKPISEGKTSLKEIYIALGYFIKTFGRNYKIEEELTEDTEPGGNNKEEGLTTNLFLLNSYINKLNDDGKREIIDKIIPFIARLVLKADQLFPIASSFPILIQGKNEKINLTKEQCACLMAHMFMCVTLDQYNSKIASLRNFSQLYTDTRSKFPWRAKMKMEKLKFIFNYFKRLMKEVEIPPREIIFNRLVYDQECYEPVTSQAWTECKDTLLKAEVNTSAIPETNEGGVQVCFSDRKVGDQTLSLGATQQQIIFLTHPELIISILFCENLQDKEVLLTQGVEKFCTHSGFSNSFAFAKDYKDTCPLAQTENATLDREIIMMDALDFKKNKDIFQFSEDAIFRELNKAYVGFLGDDVKAEDTPKKPIWTGKWGCGVYGGNVQLKFLLQWIAASRAKRDMVFYLYEDLTGIKNVDGFISHFQNKEIGALMKLLLKYAENMKGSSGNENDLFEALVSSGS